MSQLVSVQINECISRLLSGGKAHTHLQIFFHKQPSPLPQDLVSALNTSLLTLLSIIITEHSESLEPISGKDWEFHADKSKLQQRTLKSCFLHSEVERISLAVLKPHNANTRDLIRNITRQNLSLNPCVSASILLYPSLRQICDISRLVGCSFHLIHVMIYEQVLFLGARLNVKTQWYLGH